MGILSKRLKRLRTGARAGNGRPGVRNAGPSATLGVFALDLDPNRADQPASGSQICEGLTLYNDAASGLFSWQQTADKTLKLTVYQFEGSYISLAIGMGEEKIGEMCRSGLLEVKAEIESTRPIAAFLRLNVQIDGEARQMHQTFIVDHGLRKTVFDLDGLPGNSGDFENAWLDLIFADPRMIEITVSLLAIGAVSAETNVV